MPGAVGERARRRLRFAPMADDRDIRRSRDRAASAPLPDVTAMMALADMRAGEFLHDRRIDIEWRRVGKRRMLRLAQRGDRLGVQHDARRLDRCRRQRVPASA